MRPQQYVYLRLRRRGLVGYRPRNYYLAGGLDCPGMIASGIMLSHHNYQTGPRNVFIRRRRQSLLMVCNVL